MSGWRVFVSGAASAFGALAFLTLVANEIERVEQDLRRWDARERETLRKRKIREAMMGSSTGEKAA